MQNFINRLIRLTVKVVLAAFGLVFAVSLLLAALLVVSFSLLMSLFTGKKPAPLMMFSRFRQYAPGGIWPGTARAQNPSDVVDVEVREVQPDDQPVKSDRTSP